MKKRDKEVERKSGKGGKEGQPLLVEKREGKEKRRETAGWGREDQPLLL